MSPSSALAIIRRALPTATEAERHFIWAQTGFETSWGDGWLDNSLGLAAHNWGANQDPNGFTYVDHHADGTEYVGHYAVYASDEDGVRGAAANVLKPNVRLALARRDGRAAVLAMKANGYFEADPEKYVAAVSGKYDSALSATGEPRILSFQNQSSAFSALLLVGVALGGGALVLSSGKKRKAGR